MTQLPRRRGWLIAGGVALLIAFFFQDYLVSRQLPVTSADPAIIYHSRTEAGEWLRQGVLPLWRPGANVGVSTFTTDATQTAFHLSAVLFAVVPDPEVAMILLVAIQVLVLVTGTIWLLVRRFGVPPAIALMGAATFLFTPGFHNEFLFNTFGGYGFVPFQICLVDRLRERQSWADVVWLALLLVLAYAISNIAAVQFSVVLLGCYLLYLEAPRWQARQIRTALSPVLRLGAAVALFLVLSSFYLVPFVTELAVNQRSHLYGFFTSLAPLPWLLSFHVPFTSWIFIDEQMFTTGLLTGFETLNRYSHLLFLPSLLLFVAHRPSFSRAEAFFFFFAAGFVLLSIVNRWIPLLDLVVYLTRGTGWHRAVPLYFFSAAVCLAIVTTKLVAGDFRATTGRVGALVLRGYRLHRGLLLGAYATATLATIGCVVAVKGLEWTGVYDLLGLVTDRPQSHLAFYLEHHLAFPQVLYLLVVPTGLTCSLWAFERLRAGAGRGVLAALVAGVIGSQIGLAHLYYPFNRGVTAVSELPVRQWLENSMPGARTAIVFNEPTAIERELIARRGLPDDLHNPELHLLSNPFPEFSRFQSNITMQGSFFNTIGASMYTRGANMTSGRLDRFHQAVLEDNPFLQSVWGGGKGYLRIGQSEVGSALLDVAGVNQLLSSLPLEGPGFRLRARGEVYHLYDNLGAAPRFVFTSDVRVVADGDEAFEAIRESGFDPRSMAIIEGDGARPRTGSAPGQVTIVSYQPNEVVVDVAAPAAGVLVYNDAFHPGWTAFVDEASRPILRANYLFKGVALDAGRHRVTFAYRPPGLRLGVWMSGIGMGLAVAILVLSRRRQAGTGGGADR
ncbi:MAG: hypothetical protein CL483_03415 [Acidobacteria bacterium]|nr:hypothetical protein [Acidobacteriota bacterium]